VVPFAKAKLAGPAVAGSNSSLKVIWMVGVRETPVAPLAGDVDVMVSGLIGAGAASTMKTLLKDAVCVPVVTVTVRAPVAANGSIVNRAVALAGVATVSMPGWPSATPATLMPGPKLAIVNPCTKFEPVRTTVKIWPTLPALGLTEAIVGAGGAAPVFTAIVTVFEVVPPIEITTGTASPGAALAGTCARTW
jgi:hypothetical protein